MRGQKKERLSLAEGSRLRGPLTVAEAKVHLLFVQRKSLVAAFANVLRHRITVASLEQVAEFGSLDMSPKSPFLEQEQSLLRKLLALLRTIGANWVEDRRFEGPFHPGAPRSGRAAAGSAFAAAPGGAGGATLHIPGAWGGRS